MPTEKADREILGWDGTEQGGVKFPRVWTSVHGVISHDTHKKGKQDKQSERPFLRDGNKSTHDHGRWEARVERESGFEVRDLLRAERDIERGDVRLEVLDLAPAYDREHVRRLVHQVRDRHYPPPPPHARTNKQTTSSRTQPVIQDSRLDWCQRRGTTKRREDCTRRTCLNARRADLARNNLERGAHLTLVWSALPVRVEDHAPILACFATRGLLRICADLARGENIPGSERQA